MTLTLLCDSLISVSEEDPKIYEIDHMNIAETGNILIHDLK